MPPGAAAAAAGHTAGPEPSSTDRPFAPDALPGPDILTLPETVRYRLKNALLGPPLATERQTVERLGKIAGLGVLAPDMISSSAYGTEEMLTQLVPWFGVAAFALLVPVTLVILGILVFVTLSYLEVIKAYTKAGGSYVVARDNFGPRTAQVAAVALLIDYTVTVAVQCTAGTDALTSLVPKLVPYTVPVTVAVIIILCYGNLRGIREGAKTFALPTYLFILGLGSVIVVGMIREALGDVPAKISRHAGMLPFGQHSGLVAFAAIIVILRGVANGGSSLTGLEAISNSVGAFRRPEARNGRITLVVMSSVLGFLVLGVTLLAHWSHASPYAAGSPTVVAQVAGWVCGTRGVGMALRDLVVIATMLILFTGGNTSFNGFPYLASFVAADSFLPRQLTRRGHRLAFSNGIIVLAVVGYRPRGRHGRQSHKPRGALRDRRLHRLHHGRSRDGEAPSHAARGRLALPPGDQRLCRRAFGRRRPHLRRVQVHRGCLAGGGGWAVALLVASPPPPPVHSGVRRAGGRGSTGL